MWKIGIVGTVWAGMLAVAIFAGPLGADDAQEAYQSLFGEKAKKAAASASKRDDVELAKEILAAVKEVAASPRLQILLCEKAYEFAIHDKNGYTVAIGAAKRLAELAPHRRNEVDDKLLEVYALQFRKSTGETKKRVARPLLGQLIIHARRKRRAGKATEAIALYRRAATVATYAKSPRRKEIVDEIKEALVEQKIEREIAALEKALKKDPADQSSAGKLLLLYLIERDRPHKAVSLLEAAEADEHLKTYVPMASAEPDTVAVEACVELGSWYEGLADKAAGDVGKKKMLLRAKTYFVRFLKLHTKKDVNLLKATLALERIDKQLEKLGGKPRVRNVAGVLWATVDDLCEVRINGKPVLQTDIRNRKSAKVTLNPGDLITVQLVDTGGQVGFCFAFQGEGADVEFSSNTRSWFIYTPASANSWWKVRPNRKARRAREGNNRGIHDAATRMAPRPLQVPCEMIWGQGRQCYLYHVVTVDELRGSGLKCVSTDATYTTSSIYQRQRPLPVLLTGKGDLYGRVHAFHTELEASPYIIITLKKAFPIKRIAIKNRRDPGLYSRARGLTVWVSSDRKRWKPIWTAAKAQASWRIDLKTPVTARYVKIGLRRTDFLHLASVRIYSK